MVKLDDTIQRGEEGGGGGGGTRYDGLYGEAFSGFRQLKH